MLTSRAGYAECWQATVTKRYTRWIFLQETRPATKSLIGLMVMEGGHTQPTTKAIALPREWERLLKESGA